MTKLKHMLGAKHSQEEVEEVHFLYKYFDIKPEPQSSALRKLHHETFLLVTEQNKQPESSRQKEQLQSLEGWDCSFRFPVWRYHTPTKEWHRKVLCFNPKTREIVKSNELDAEVCKRCNDTGGSANLPELPEPKRSISKAPSKPVSKASKPDRQKLSVYVKRKCKECHGDFFPKYPDHELCTDCWRDKEQKKKYPDYTKESGHVGSQKWHSDRAKERRLKSEAVLEKAMACETMEEVDKLAIQHGDEWTAKYDAPPSMPKIQLDLDYLESLKPTRHCGWKWDDDPDSPTFGKRIIASEEERGYKL